MNLMNIAGTDLEDSRKALLSYVYYYISGLELINRETCVKEISRCLENECGIGVRDYEQLGMFTSTGYGEQGLPAQETVLILKRIMEPHGSDSGVFSGISFVDDLVVKYKNNVYCRRFSEHIECFLELEIYTTVRTLIAYTRMILPNDCKLNTNEREIFGVFLKQSVFEPRDVLEIDTLEVIERYCRAGLGRVTCGSAGSKFVNDLLEIGHRNRRYSNRHKVSVRFYSLMKSVEISRICSTPEFIAPKTKRHDSDKSLMTICSVIGLSRDIDILKGDYESFMKREDVLVLQSNATLNNFYTSTPAEFRASYSGVTRLLHAQLTLPVILEQKPSTEFNEVFECVFKTRRRVEHTLKMYVVSLLRCKLHDAGLVIARSMIQQLAAIQYRRYKDFVEIYETMKDIQLGLQDIHLLCTKYGHKGHMVIKLAQTVVLTSVLANADRLCTYISSMQTASRGDVAILEELYKQLLRHERVITSQILVGEFDKLIYTEVCCLTHFDDVCVAASSWAGSFRVWQKTCKDALIRVLQSPKLGRKDRVAGTYLDNYLKTKKGRVLCQQLGLGRISTRRFDVLEFKLTALQPLLCALMLNRDGLPKSVDHANFESFTALKRLWNARERVYASVINYSCTDSELTKTLFQMYVGEVPEEYQ